MSMILVLYFPRILILFLFFMGKFNTTNDHSSCIVELVINISASYLVSPIYQISVSVLVAFLVVIRLLNTSTLVILHVNWI